MIIPCLFHRQWHITDVPLFFYFNIHISFVVEEIVDKFDNKGLKDKIFADSFVSYITEERSLQEIVLQNINSSLLPRPTKPSSYFSSLMSRLSHVTSPDYIKNNRQHVLTSAIFLSVLCLAMVVRAVQFIGKLQ